MSCGRALLGRRVKPPERVRSRAATVTEALPSPQRGFRMSRREEEPRETGSTTFEAFDPDVHCARCGRKFAHKCRGGVLRLCMSCDLAAGVPLEGGEQREGQMVDEALSRIPYLSPARTDAAWRLLLRRLPIPPPAPPWNDHGRHT